MDTVTPMGRRFAGPPPPPPPPPSVPGGAGDYHDLHNHHAPPPPPMQLHHQPGNYWYPPPSSGDPHHFPPPHPHQQPQHPPPPSFPPGPTFTPLPPPHYPHLHLHQPHSQPWAPPPDHLQQQYQPSSFSPAVPPPFSVAPPPSAAVSPHRHGAPPPPPPKAPYPASRPAYPPPPPAHAHASHVQPSPPLPPASLPHAYSQHSQTWGNPPWHATQDWDYTDTKFHFNNEEDWAARARAWAAANSGTESLVLQAQYMPSGTPQYMPSGTPNNVHNDQYQHGAVPPFADGQHSSFSTPDQQFPDSATDLHRRVNNLQEPSLNSMSYSVTNFPSYDARDEGLATDSSVTVSPPQRTFSSSSSVNVQEVSSSYSSFSGNKEAPDQFEKLNLPLPLSSPMMSVPGRLPTLSINPIAMEQSHLPYRDQSIEYSESSDRSQATEQIPFDQGQTHSVSVPNTDQGRPLDQSAASSSIHGWAQPIAPGPVFPHVTPAPPGSQFDSSAISSSLPGHPAQVFGRMQGPNFQPGISSVVAPFGFDAGSFHPATTFPLEANETFNMSERPKKAAVPNWLRDEIIKKKAVIASSAHEHPNGGSSHSTVAEFHDKISRKDELADSKSVDSARSTEEEDNDEEDVDAVRSAAINQEIKRVLTDVLLKVTDELFEEIATKVLNEDEVEVDHSPVAAKHKESASPPPTPKNSAKVVASVAPTAEKSSAMGHSLLVSSGGDVLGLANYASDDDSDETQGSSVPFPVKAHDSSDQLGIRDVASEDSLKQEKASVPVAAEPPGNGPLYVESGNRNSAVCNGVLTQKNGLEAGNTGRTARSFDSVSALEQSVPVREKLDMESESAHGHSDNVKSKIGHVTESRSKSGSSDTPQDRKTPFDKHYPKEVESVAAKGNREDSDAGNVKKRTSRDQILEKMDERVISKQRTKDQGSKQATDTNESESRRMFYHDNDVDEKKVSGREKRDRPKEDDRWKRERTRDEKEDRSRHSSRDSYRQKNKLASSPVARGRNGKDNSLGSPSDGSGEDISEASKKRKSQSSRHSLSPSPTRSRRQVMRSPNSKHAQRRHSPYSHSDARRRRRSRSGSPAHRKRSGHNR